MRKVLLATTAIVGVAFAGAAHAAASSPISLNVGGYDDFVAGVYHQSQGVTPGLQTNNHDFENEFKLNFDAMGKASNGIEYGANISLWNGAEVGNAWQGGGNGVSINSAYVWMSGAFGKVLFGDEHGASDLFVYAPTVGEGQIDGRYMDFTNSTKLARFQASGIDNTEHSTKITYYTPKIGNDQNKVQLGVSYLPNMYDYGQDAVKYSNNLVTNGLIASPYQDVVKVAGEYWANYHPVHAAVSAQLISGNSSHAALGTTIVGSGLAGSTAATTKAQDFTAWGLGAQIGTDWVGGLTVGGSFVDMGRYNTVHGQNQDQNVWTLGGKYEFDKVGVALNYIGGEGYNNLLSSAGDFRPGSTTQNYNYVSNFNGYGAGATYTWFPGLTSAIDGVLYTQQVQDQTDHNDGYVVLVSQKLTF